MSEHNHALRQAYEMIKAGDKKGAYQTLVPVLKADKDNANAWWLLANCAPSPDKMRMALKHVLRLRPDNAKAQQMLQKLESRQQPAAPSPAQPTLAVAPVPAAEPEEKPFWADFPEPGDDQTAHDDPFQYLDAAAAEAAPARPRASAQAKPQPKKQSGGGSTDLLILGGVGIIAVVVIAAAIILAVNKLQSSGGSSNECPPEVEIPLAAIEQDPDLVDRQISLLGCTERGNNVRNSIDPWSDDGWAFWGEAGETYTIEVNALDDFVDAEVYLFGPGGGRVAYNDDFDLPRSLDSRLDLQLNVSGTYTIVVSIWGFVSGDYELKLY
jgi:hypothetical protein